MQQRDKERERHQGRHREKERRTHLVSSCWQSVLIGLSRFSAINSLLFADEFWGFGRDILAAVVLVLLLEAVAAPGAVPELEAATATTAGCSFGGLVAFLIISFISFVKHVAKEDGVYHALCLVHFNGRYSFKKEGIHFKCAKGGRGDSMVFE